MTAAPVPPEPVAPPPEPKAIRACLSSTMTAGFDREWEYVVERAKQAKDLDPITNLLHKWRHFAYMEMREPGAYYRVLARSEEILAGAEPPEGSINGDELMARPNGLVIYPEAQVQIGALPGDAADALYKILFDRVLNNPWDGEPQHEEFPDVPVRSWLFNPHGAGILVYQIVERERDEVHLLRVSWAR